MSDPPTDPPKPKPRPPDFWERLGAIHDLVRDLAWATGEMYWHQDDQGAKDRTVQRIDVLIEHLQYMRCMVTGTRYTR